MIILSGGRSIDVMKARGGVSGCLKQRIAAIYCGEGGGCEENNEIMM